MTREIDHLFSIYWLSFFPGLDFAPLSDSCLFLIDLYELFKYYDYHALSLMCVANIFSPDLWFVF